MPGLAAVAVVAIAASWVTALLPASVSVITVGLVAGLVVANSIGLPERFGPGIRFAVTVLLRLGIVLMGARLSLAAVLDTSLGAVAVKCIRRR